MNAPADTAHRRRLILRWLVVGFALTFWLAMQPLSFKGWFEWVVPFLALTYAGYLAWILLTRRGAPVAG